MPDTKLTNIDLQLEWKSPTAFHADVLHLAKVDLSQDKLPAGFGEKITELAVGENFSKTLSAKDLLGEGFATDKVISFNSKFFDSQFKSQNSPPIQYRFYPTAIAWQGLNADSSDYTPFRLISINEDTMVADRNHPLAKYYLTLTATKTLENEVSLSKNRLSRDLGKLLTSRGPGMQASFEFGDPVFFKQYPFQLRQQDNSQKVVNNTTAIHDPKSSVSLQVAKLYTRLLAKHSKVLDLMSHSESYLGDEFKAGLIVGLGNNEKALSDNKSLDTYSVQEMNSTTTLPYESDSFDDAICSFSIEQLTDPLAVLQEIARVVVSGGKFIITFSEQYSSSSAIPLWAQLHPFERMQLVLEYFRHHDLFSDLNTYSVRGLASKNEEKKAASQIFAVWGTIK